MKFTDIFPSPPPPPAKLAFRKGGGAGTHANAKDFLHRFRSGIPACGMDSRLRGNDECGMGENHHIELLPEQPDSNGRLPP